MADNILLTCLFCQHFTFTPKYKDYSEDTPGQDESFVCGKKKWVLYGEDMTTEDLRRNMLKAGRCEEFLAIKLEET